MKLPRAFIEKPLAHRGLHDASRDCPENSRAAVLAAIAHEYGIEIDVQLSRDDEAFVFHDHELARLTGEDGQIGETPANALADMRLLNTKETIPHLSDVLAIVGGRVPILIEIKNADESLTSTDGRLEAAVCRELEAYNGPVAVMSFHPESVKRCAVLAPRVPRGLVTGSFSAREWPDVPADRLGKLRAMSSLPETGASFVSHEWQDLVRDTVETVRNRGIDILCWTVRSKGEEVVARRHASNITFEGYLAQHLRE